MVQKLGFERERRSEIVGRSKPSPKNAGNLKNSSESVRKWGEGAITHSHFVQFTFLCYFYSGNHFTQAVPVAAEYFAKIMHFLTTRTHVIP